MVHNIFDSIVVMRDDYKLKFETIINDYKSKIHSIEQNYKPSAPLFAEETQKAEQEKNNKIRDLQELEKSFIEKEFLSARAIIDAEIAVLPSNDAVIANLQRLYNLPLSKCEIEVLARKYEDTNYWTRKIVADLAQKNGVQVSFKKADAQTMIDVLDNLETRVNNFFDDWQGKDSQYNALASLADSQLIKLERRYTNNFKDMKICDRKNVQIALTDVTSKRDLFSQSIYLKNLYDNCDDAQKKYLLYEIDNNHSIYHDAIRSAQLDIPLDTFKISHEYTQIDNAVKAADSLRLMKNVSQEDIEDKINEHGGYSPYMKSEIHNLYGSHNDNANNALEATEMAQNESN